MTKLAEWPMSHLVMLTGIVLALATGGRVVATGWAPPESWLLFITGCLTITFGIKRTTHTDLWRKGPTAASTTTTSTTTTKGPEPPVP